MASTTDTGSPRFSLSRGKCDVGFAIWWRDFGKCLTGMTVFNRTFKAIFEEAEA